MQNYPDLTKWFSPEVMDQLRSTESCVVSFSGGVDSAVVLKVISHLIGPEKVHAVTFSSWLHLKKEMDRTVGFTNQIGARHVIIKGPELSLKGVVCNHPDRCALCKEARIKELLRYAREHSLEKIYEGSNLDDLGDPTRLGTKLLKKYPRIYSPLAEAGLNKRNVRELAEEMEIAWWEEEATACLATRFPPFEKLEEEKLQIVGAMEDMIRENGFPQIRIRVYRDLACIEVPEKNIAQAIEKKEILVSLLQENGFSRIVLDLEGYSGGRSWFGSNPLNNNGGRK